MARQFLGFVVGLMLGAGALSASAQSWDLPAEIRALRVAIDSLVSAMAKDAVSGQAAPQSGPVLHLVAPDGTAVPAAATSDGRLRVEITTPVVK
jgi:hypothetical protein